MAALVCCLCGGWGMPEKMLECFRCESLQHGHCHINDVNFILCNFCLQDDKKKPHEWIKKLAGIDFREECNDNYFCGVCYKHYCDRCCPVSRRHRHANHPKMIIKVMHLGEGRFVRPQDVIKFYDYFSDIQPEIPDCLPLDRKLGTPLGGEKSCGFHGCDHKIINTYEFCSVQCKFEEIGWDSVPNSLDKNMFVTGLLKREFIPGHRRYSFCLICHRAFSSGACEHHGSHSSIPIMEKAGCLFAQFTECSHSMWLGALSGIHSDREQVAKEIVIVSVPLMPRLPQPDSLQQPMCCQCGNRIGNDMLYCSLPCMEKYGLPDQ